MKDALGLRPWFRAMIFVGAVYFVVGLGFAALANSAASHPAVFRWRLVAWLASAAVFAAHIGYEHFRQNHSARATALHAAMAAAFGAFLLAVAATVHAGLVASHAPYWRFLLALVIWPIGTALPAFVVALAGAAVLARLPTKHDAEKLVIYCIPSLVATLLNREQAKGSPLTEEEVLQIRDGCSAIALSPATAESMDEERGYKDIDPEHCWEQWQEARKELSLAVASPPTGPAGSGTSLRP